MKSDREGERENILRAIENGLRETLLPLTNLNYSFTLLPDKNNFNYISFFLINLHAI